MVWRVYPNPLKGHRSPATGDQLPVINFSGLFREHWHRYVRVRTGEVVVATGQTCPYALRTTLDRIRVTINFDDGAECELHGPPPVIKRDMCGCHRAKTRPKSRTPAWTAPSSENRTPRSCGHVRAEITEIACLK